MKLVAHICASVLAPALIALFSNPATAAAQQQQQFRIEGEVVQRVGDQDSAIIGVHVEIRRNGRRLDSKTTGDGGSYQLTFDSGGPLDIFYGDSQWRRVSVLGISGNKSHRITKVLTSASQTAQLSPEQADEILATLEYMNSYPSEFAEELNQSLSNLKEVLPAEFRERFERVEQAVAARQKQTPVLPLNRFGPRPVISPISDDKTASLRPPQTKYGFFYWRPESVSFFKLQLEELHLPPEVVRLRNQRLSGTPPATFIADLNARNASPRLGFNYSFSNPLANSYSLIGSHQFYQSANPPTAVGRFTGDPGFFAFMADASLRDTCYSPPAPSKLYTNIDNISGIKFGLNDLSNPYPSYLFGGISFDFPIYTPTGIGLGSPYNPYQQKVYQFPVKLIFGDPDPTEQTGLKVTGANLFSIAPGKEYSLEITDPSINKDSVLTAPAAKGISVLLNNPDPAAHALRATLAVSDDTEPAQYKLLVQTSEGPKPLSIIVSQAPPEVTGEASYPGADGVPPKAGLEGVQELQVVIKGKHLKGAKVETVGETSKWIKIKGDPIPSPDGTTLTLNVVVSERALAGSYALRISNANPEKKTRDVLMRIVPGQ